MTKKHLPKFIGGTHNGAYLPEEYKVNGKWPGVFYLPTKINIEEAQSLNIDGAVKWRNPDDVYDFLGANYVFRERIDYMPKETLVDITLDELHLHLEKCELSIEEFIEEFNNENQEMFETGSAEFVLGSREFIIGLSIQEIKK